MKLARARIVVGWLFSLTLAAACTAPATVDNGEEFGSLRNARVAVESPQRELVYFAGALEPAELEQLAQAAPNVKVVAGLSREQALERAQEADGVEARFATAEFFDVFVPAHGESLSGARAKKKGRSFRRGPERLIFT